MPISVALCSFEGPLEDCLSTVSGGYGEGETPLPIPNRAVKPLSADGTWPSRARESRTPPVYSHEPPLGAAHLRSGAGGVASGPRGTNAADDPRCRGLRGAVRRRRAVRGRVPARLPGPADQARPVHL